MAYDIEFTEVLNRDDLDIYKLKLIFDQLLSNC